MNRSIYVNWGNQVIRLTWLPEYPVPNIRNVTSVHAYCFYRGKILLANIMGRGFNVPGGNVEEGESPLEAVQREAWEEGYIKGTFRYMGAIEVNHEDNPFFKQGGKYPLIGYQLFYRMDVTDCHPFLGEYESSSRIWMNPNEFKAKVNDHSLSELILKKALYMPEKNNKFS